MKLSVIIPCLNGEATLAVQLKALAAQQWTEPWELIISDNGSSDKSLEVAREYQECFSAFRIIKASDKKYSSYPRNAGVRAASSDRLAFCDADDEVAPGWVASIGDALCKYDIVYGQFRFDKFNEPRQAKVMEEQWKTGLYKGRFLPGGGTGNLGIRRWVHEAIGGFDERLPRFADADYFWRLQLEGFELHYLSDAIVQVRKVRVKPSLSYLYRRGRTAAMANYWNYKKYRHLGMLPPPSLKKSLSILLNTLRRALSIGLLHKDKRVSWLKQLAQQTGDLTGQLQGRITNPCKPYHPGKKGIELLQAYGFQVNSQVKK